MKNFLGKIVGIKTKKKTFYLSAFILICFFVALPSSSAHAIDIFGDSITEGISGWISTFVFEVLMIVFQFASLLVNFSAWLVDMMLDPAMYRSILVGLPDATTGKPTGAVALGWQTIRDFCNMFYVFFLLLIAFSTIVGNQTYSAKSLLPKFIISLFLINFSAEITKMVIDVGQVFLFGMASWLGTFSGSQGSGHALTGIVNYFEQSLGSLDNPSSEDIISLIFAVLYTFALAAVYAALAGFLLFRLVMFAALIIVSPFAFFSMVLPFMGRYKTQWQSLLISNAISGPVLLFFVYISAMMAKNLVDNPIAVTAGDTSKMTFMSNILVRIVPHMVALGMLLFGIKAATSVGAAGSNYIAGGNFYGAGKMAGMGYAGFKLGERATRRAAGGATRGVGAGIEMGKRNSTHFAGAMDDLHKGGQDLVGWAGAKGGRFGGGIASGMIQKDMARQDAAKQKMGDERLKNYGGKLEALDLDLLRKGDNVDQVLLLKAAAAQGKLGDSTLALAAHFGRAQSVMSNSDVKDLTSKNLAFNTLTAENEAKIKSKDDSSFDEDAKKRIAATEKLGYSKEKAIGDEIKRDKLMTLQDAGETGKIQDFEDEDTARVVVGSLTGSQLGDLTKKMSKKTKAKLSSGIDKSQVTMRGNLEIATEEAKTVPEADRKLDESKIEVEYTKGGTAAIGAGSRLTGAFARKDPTKADTDYDEKINTFLEKEIKIADVADLHEDDMKKEGWRLGEAQIKGLAAKKDYQTVGRIVKSLEEQKAYMIKNPGPTPRAQIIKKISDKKKFAEGRMT